MFTGSGQTVTWPVAAGESSMSQGPAAVHFGLGSGTAIDRVEIDWPDAGGTSVLDYVRPDSDLIAYGPEALFPSDFD